MGNHSILLSSIPPPLSSSTALSSTFISSRRHDHAFFLPSSLSSFDFQPIISCSIAHFAIPTTRIRNNRLVVSSSKNSSLYQSSSLYHHSSLLQSCIASGSFDLGRSILAQMLIRGLHPDPFLQAKILMLYVRNGGDSNLVTARHLFDTITERNLTAWNTMILGYAQVGGHSEVIDLFLGMMASGICPDRFTFPSVIKAFIALEHWNCIPLVHGMIIKICLVRNVVIGSTLIDGYVASGYIDDAANAFKEIDDKNVVTWNALIGGYDKSSRWNEAWITFYCMIDSTSVSPDHFTFATAIRACGALGILDQGKQVHAKVICHGYGSDIFVCNTLIDMYVECGDGASGLQVFHIIAEKNQVSWNSIISTQARLGLFEETLRLFSKMQESGYVTQRFNLVSILSACAGMSNVRTGREIHCYLIRRSLDGDTIMGSALLDMYSKNGCIKMARRAFHRLNERNTVSWNALIAGYVQEGKSEEALQVFHSMILNHASPDQHTLSSLLTLSAKQKNSAQVRQIHGCFIRAMEGAQNLILETELVHAYGKCKRLNDAWKVFRMMTEKNSFTWNVMMETLVQNGDAEEALNLFYQMQVLGNSPDCFALASGLSACLSLSNQRKGKQIHAFLIRNMLEDHNTLRSMLLNMYAKCGNIDYACSTFRKTAEKDVVLSNVMISAFLGYGRISDARKIFDQMGERNTITWNLLLKAYAKVGYEKETFAYFQQMLEADTEFDCATLVPILNLCANRASLGQGRQLHALSIKKDLAHGSIALDSALVDMYAKCGSIEDSRVYFDRMEERNIVSWNSIITACAKHGHSKVVLSLYEQMQKENMIPNDVTFLSVLSVCSYTGLVEEGSAIFSSMLENHENQAKEEHYACFVDLLGRAGQLNEAKEVIDKMPVEPGASTWGALLGACRIHKNVDLGRLAAQKLFDLDTENSGNYILMSNIYADSGRLVDAESIKATMRTKNVVRELGCSWIEIDNKVHSFHAGDMKHFNADKICCILESLSQCMKEKERCVLGSSIALWLEVCI